ncbi:MAG TPA: DUF523 and DUF1722 domain-containing protein [Candidatus Limnocylindrales bacterium]|nr:DUF523 and DUF1722 domain-containing protein [Candidatus Limnocylindrales bacterium]
MPRSRASAPPQRPATPAHDDGDILVGVSTCLLGEHVRYDGGHKHDRYVTGVLGRYFRLVPVCPEVEAGMGVPREPVRLVRDGGRLRMLGVTSGCDHTRRMQLYARRRVAELDAMGLSGYVLKQGSPSCGMKRVRAYTTAGAPSAPSSGLFAAALLDAMPTLPLEEEGRLEDPGLRENFVERVFAHRRLQRALAPGWKIADLVELHARETLLLASHGSAAEKELGRLVAGARNMNRGQARDLYKRSFMRALARPATRARHVKVLQHVLAYFGDRIDAPARRAVASVIEDYRRARVPLLVPLAIVRHYADVCGIDSLARQTYLDPHPKELMLRNHV